MKLMILLLLLCSGLRRGDCSRPTKNLCQKAGISKNINVDLRGSGDFKSIQAAINSVPRDNKQWVRIHLAPGVYWEKVVIPRENPFILIEGSGMHATKIAWDGHDSTEQSATLTVQANDFVAKHLSIENTYNHPLRLMEEKVTRQAVAAFVEGDRNAFYDVGFYGVQDTLWDSAGRHLFRSCFIEGNTDFIFGNGQSLYQNCSINVIQIPNNPNATGYITAQARETSDSSSGFVFDYCKINGAVEAYLGRAWRNYARVIYSNSYFANVIVPKGWDAWVSSGGKEEDLTYVEYNCVGPGSNKSGRVPWMKPMDEATISKFTSLSFVNGDDGCWVSQQP